MNISIMLQRITNLVMLRSFRVYVSEYKGEPVVVFVKRTWAFKIKAIALDPQSFYKLGTLIIESDGNGTIKIDKQTYMKTLGLTEQAFTSKVVRTNVAHEDIFLEVPWWAFPKVKYDMVECAQTLYQIEMESFMHKHGHALKDFLTSKNKGDASDDTEQTRH